MKKIVQYGFLIILSGIIASCGTDDALTQNPNFIDPNAADDNPMFNEDTDTYVTGEVNGSTITFVQDVENYNAETVVSSQGGFDTTDIYTYAGFDELNDQFNDTNLFPSFGVGYQVLQLPTPPTDVNSYSNKLQVGAHPYSKADSLGSTRTEGAVVLYEDNGVLWSSDLNSGNQNGSTFEILDIKGDKDFFGDDVMVIKAKFNCKLFNSQGDSINVVNGMIRAIYRVSIR